VLRVTADDILTYAASLKGQDLRTLHKRKLFNVDVKGDRLVYTPLEKDDPKPRVHDYVTLQRICEKFSESNSLKPRDYDDTGARNASYTLALIIKYLGSVVDGTVSNSE
jgi:hypothetical protein